MTPPPTMTTLGKALASADHPDHFDAVAVAESHLVVAVARHHVAVVRDCYQAPIDVELLQQRRQCRVSGDRARLAVDADLDGLLDHALALSAVPCVVHASSKALLSSSAAAFGSAAPAMAEMTATP